MKRIQLIEWGIIAIGLIFGYKFLEGMISMIIQMITQMMYDGEFSGVVYMLLITIIYAALLFGAIRYNREIATFLAGKNQSEETLPLKIDKQALLQVVLVSIGAFTIFNNIADILYDIFNSFKDKLGRSSSESLLLTRGSTNVSLVISCIQIVVAFILVIYSQKISAALIAKKDTTDDTAINTNPEN